MTLTTLKQPPRAEVRPEELAAYDSVVTQQVSYGYTKPGPGYEKPRAVGEEAGPYFGPLLHSPLIANHLSQLGVIYRSVGTMPGSYTHRDREWIDIVLGREMGFQMWGHLADGMAVGVRPEAIIALCDNRLEDLSSEERETAEYIIAFAHGRVNTQQWGKLIERFGTRGAIEYTAFCGHLCMTIRILQAVTVARAEEMRGNSIIDDEEAIKRCREVLEGNRELPDPLARIPSKP